MNKLLRWLLRLHKKLKKLEQAGSYEAFRKKYTLAESLRFNGAHILLYGEGSIKIGHHTYIGRHSTIQSVEQAEVSIGDYCAISHYVKIYTNTYVVDQDFRTLERKAKTGSVKIGDGVWIGANVFINPGVTIGDNSVIGANSVVIKDVPENGVVAGIPAVLIRYKKADEQHF